jgi:hypothetical protein
MCLYSFSQVRWQQLAITVDVEPSAATRNAEMDSTKRMVERSDTRFGLKPRRHVGVPATTARKSRCALPTSRE